MKCRFGLNAECRCEGWPDSVAVGVVNGYASVERVWLGGPVVVLELSCCCGSAFCSIMFRCSTHDFVSLKLDSYV